MTIVRLAKWGNSAGIRIPAHIMQEAQFLLGEELQLTVNQGTLALMFHQ